jgi:hypothetical protein
MEFILLEIGNIIEQVNTARREREKKKTDNSKDDVVGIEQISGEDQRGKEEQILDPLLRPHRGNDVS